MIAAIFEGSLAIFEQNDGAVKEVKTFSSDFAPITSLLLFCNNSVVTEDQGRVIKQWNIVSGASNVIYRQAKCCQASPDGKRIAWVCSDNSINVWDISTEKCVQILSKLGSQIYFFDFSHDGNQNLWSCYDCVVSGRRQINISQINAPSVEEEEKKEWRHSRA